MTSISSNEEVNYLPTTDKGDVILQDKDFVIVSLLQDILNQLKKANRHRGIR